MFIDGLHPTQRNKLARMHIDFPWDQKWAPAWKQLLRPCFVSKLVGLQRFHATLDKRCNFHPSIGDQREIPPPCTGMQILPLQHVTVIVGDDLRIRWPEQPWTSTEKREMAAGLRNKLLNPNGHEVQAAEMRAEEAKREKGKEEEQALPATRRALRAEREKARG